MHPPDFIEEFPGALPPEACAALVARFEASGQAGPGRVAAGVVPGDKDSRDINISQFPRQWGDAEELLNRVMFTGLLAYVRKYPWFLLAPLRFEFRTTAEGELRRMRPDDLAGLDDEQLAEVLRSALRPGTINLQHYRADSGGYPAWHCEQTPSGRDELHRALLWSVYLNEGFGEGETEFLYQQRKVVPRTGTLLFAPATFIHTHRGNRPLGKDKYLATSWILFKRMEDMMGAPR